MVLKRSVKVTARLGRLLLVFLAGGRVVDLVFDRDGGEVVLKLSVFFLAHLRLELALVEDGLLGLLEGLLDAGLHPVSVVAGRLDVQVVKLLLDVLPDLTVLQEWVKLDDLHCLLFSGIELVQVESDTVESAKDGRAQVILLHNLTEQVRHVRLVVLVTTLAHVAGGLECHTQDT